MDLVLRSLLHGIPAILCPLGFVILWQFLRLEYVKEIWKKNKTFENFVTAQQAISEDKAKDGPFFIIKKVNSDASREDTDMGNSHPTQF